MTTAVRTFTLSGVDAVLLTTEVDLLRRLPSVAIIGLPSLSVRETADRVRSALTAGGYDFPRQRVVVSVAPADVRKDGTGFDLPIAAAILIAAGRLWIPADYVLAGELSLGGEVRSVRGAVAFAVQHPDLVLVCARSMAEATVRAGGRAIAIDSVAALAEPMVELVAPARIASEHHSLDFRDVRGMDEVVDALVEAAATRRTVVLRGPPGCGKTMLAARMPGLLPALTRAEALDVLRVHDAAGLSSPDTDPDTVGRPFRAPHHSASPAGLLGGATLRPGEVTLAHLGVLFLDEFAEFPRHAREVLRGPMEDKQIVLARASGRTVMPADFWLVVATNPCPCGNHGHPTRVCVCSPATRERYDAQWVGDQLLRDALVIDLPVPTSDAILTARPGRTTAELRDRSRADTACPAK